MFSFALVGLFLSSSFIINSYSATIRVDDDSSCNSSCDGSSSSPYLTIQDGLDDTSGGTLLIQDGTYTGIGNINITLSSSYTIIKSQNGPLNTIIDCQNNGASFAVLFSGTFELSGFTIRNCNAQYREWTYNDDIVFNGSWGGGLHIESTHTQLDNLIIEGNTADIGGGLSIFSSSVFMKNSIIRTNIANERGGGVHILSGYLRLINVTIEDNDSYMHGGGLHAMSTSVELNNYTVISDNSCLERGDQVFCKSAAVTVKDDSSEIDGDNYCYDCSLCGGDNPSTTQNGATKQSSSVGVFALLTVYVLSVYL